MIPQAVLDPEAELDIDAVANYIALQNIDAALRFYDAVANVIDRVAEMPGVARTTRRPKRGTISQSIAFVAATRKFSISDCIHLTVSR